MKRRLRVGDLWTILYRAADPFGGPILTLMLVLRAIGILCRAKAAGLIDMLSAHDDDLVSWDPENPEDYLDPDDPIHGKLKAIKALLDKAALPMHMITCNLHSHSLFTAGGFTNRDPAIRLLARKKALRAAWIGNFLGATIITYWTARDGFESAICDPRDVKNGPYAWLIEALNMIAFACKANGYTIKRGTIEVKVNEPRGYTYVRMVGFALYIITLLDDPEFWGVNPEVLQHASMGNQSPYLEIKEAVQNGKLSFLHIGGQIAGEFDNDFPPLVGENQQMLVLIFLLLAEVGWGGPYEYDCHALRSDLAAGLSEEEVDEIFWQFLVYCTEMCIMIEHILVPRLRTNPDLVQALLNLNTPKHSTPDELLSYQHLLSLPPSNASVQQIVAAQVPVQGIMRAQQKHLKVERVFQMIMFGVSESDLDMAMERATENGRTSQWVGKASLRLSDFPDPNLADKPV